MNNQRTHNSLYSRSSISRKYRKGRLAALMLGLFCHMLMPVAGAIAAEYEVFYFEEGTVPMAVSSDGSVIAGAMINPAYNPYDPDDYSGYNLLFRWTRESGMITKDVSHMLFANPEEYNRGPYVSGISADGSTIIAVALPFRYSGHPPIKNPKALSVLWKNGTDVLMLPSGPVPGFAHEPHDFGVYAQALTPDGAAVGGHLWYLDPNLYNRSVPFRWTEATGTVMLAPAKVFPEKLTVELQPMVTHFSDDGSVLVGYLRPTSGWDSAADPYIKEFFYWSETDGMTEIHVPEGRPQDWDLVGLSDDGSTVYFTLTDHKETFDDHGHVLTRLSRVQTVWSWSEETGWVTVLAAEEMLPSEVYPDDSNRIEEIWLWEDELMVMGWFESGPEDYFLWTESGGLVLFNDLLSKAGVASVSTNLGHPFRFGPPLLGTGNTAVSRDGKTIIGTGLSNWPEGPRLGFVIYITETGEPIWVGVKDSDWFVAANWQSGRVPGADDDVMINATSEQGVTLSEQPGVARLLIVGDNDYGSLTVKDGAVLSSDKAIIARQIAGVGAILVIDVGSRWDNTDDIVVGDEGLGALTVADHATVQTDTMAVGRVYGSTGVVNVVGGASLLIDGELTVGERGTGEVTVEDGGLVTAASAVIGGDDGADGTFMIRGDKSSAHVTDVIEIGTVGTGTLSIESGGKLGGEDGTVGLAGGSGRAIVEGKGSKWELAGDLVVGHSGAGEVDIKDGGLLTSKRGTVGLDAYGSVNVSGALTGWNVTEDLEIGVRALGLVSITDRAWVDSNAATLAVTSDSVGAGFIGNGATWAVLKLTVGLHGLGTLALEDGGNVLVSDMVLGVHEGSRGAVLVKGVAETWSALNVFGSLTVGAGGEGLLQFENGSRGTITGYAHIAAGGRGEVKVFHPGTSLSTANLDVGHSAGLGTMQISHGGTVSVSEGALTIARHEDSVGVVSIGFLDEGIPQPPGFLEAKSIVFGPGKGSLVFVHDSDGYVLETDIIGDGVIEHVHGHTIIKGDASGFTGTTEIVGGKLSIEGELGGTLDVQGGSIGGNGTLPPVTVLEGGTVAPGGSIGTLRTAEITFEPGSTYEVEVNAQGESDLIEVTGTATIGGGLVLVIPYPDYAVDTPYTILTAEGGIDGEFDASDVTEGFTLLKPTVAYDPNAVVLTLELNGLDFSDVANTRNQKAVASVVETAGPGDLVWNAMALLDEGKARAALDDLSGEIHASVKAGLLDEAGIVRDVVRGRADERATSGVWGQLLGAQSSWASDGNAAPYRRSLTGGIVGWDGDGADWHFGVLGGVGSGRHDVASRASVAASSTTHLGAYADLDRDAWQVLAGVTHSTHRVQSERHVRFAGLDETNTAAYNAHTTQLFGEVSRTLAQSGYTWQPYVALSWSRLATAAFSEGGHVAEPPPAEAKAQALGGMATMTASETNATALAARAETMQTTITEIGVQTQTDFALGAVPASAYGRIGWRHAFGDTTPSAKVALADGSPFETAGVGLGHGLSFETGLNMQFSDAWLLGFAYDGRFGPAQDHRIQFGLQVGF